MLCSNTSKQSRISENPRSRSHRPDPENGNITGLRAHVILVHIEPKLLVSPKLQKPFRNSGRDINVIRGYLKTTPRVPSHLPIPGGISDQHVADCSVWLNTGTNPDHE